MVPEGWSIEPVGEVLQRVVRPVKIDLGQTYQEIGIRSHGRGLFDKEPVTGADIGNKRVFWVEPECFVVNIVFAWEQAVGKTTEKDVGKIASHRFPMYRPKNGRCDIDFINYLFKTPRGKHVLGLASPGGAGRNKTLGQKEFDRVPLLLPPVAEQRKIAEILSTWDRAIETVEKLIANSRAQKKALLQQLFTGNRRLPRYFQAWKKQTLGALGSFSKGKGIKRDQVLSVGLPCVRYGEIYTHHHDYIRRFYSFIPPEIANTSQRIEKGDLLFTGSGETAEEIGKCVAYLGDEEAYAGGDIVIFSPERNDPKFLSYLMNSPLVVSQKTRMGQGNSVVHISGANLARLSFSIPEIEEQREIAGILSEADRSLFNLTDQARHLRSERAALMEQLLTGKRRVKVAEVAA